MAKHQSAGELFGHLSSVDAENTFLLGAQCPGQLAKVGQQADLVGRRVAHHHARRVAPMGGQDGQAALDLSVGFVPGRFYEYAVALDQWLAQAVGVFMQVFQRHTADVAGAENIRRRGRGC